MSTQPDLDVSDHGLREADRQLAMLEDCMLDEEGTVATWVVAARAAVRRARQEGEHE